MNKQLSSEDAVKAYGGRFEMVLAASQRARELKNGHAEELIKVRSWIYCYCTK
jgi:DNA-directed RNA polymerase subunit K/omega